MVKQTHKARVDDMRRFLMLNTPRYRGEFLATHQDKVMLREILKAEGCGTAEQLMAYMRRPQVK